jgi:hypothetical protein
MMNVLGRNRTTGHIIAATKMRSNEVMWPACTRTVIRPIYSRRLNQCNSLDLLIRREKKVHHQYMSLGGVEPPPTSLMFSSTLECDVGGLYQDCVTSYPQSFA